MPPREADTPPAGAEHNEVQRARVRLGLRQRLNQFGRLLCALIFSCALYAILGSAAPGPDCISPLLGIATATLLELIAAYYLAGMVIAGLLVCKFGPFEPGLASRLWLFGTTGSATSILAASHFGAS